MPETADSARGSDGTLVSVFAPTGRDADLITQVLAPAGVAVRTERSIEEVCDRLDEEAGVVVLAEETLPPPAVRCLLGALDRQPSWSDLPVLILTAPSPSGRVSQGLLEALRERSNVTLLERPVRPVTLVTAVQAALRARRRQLEVRNYLEERARAEERLRHVQKLDAVGKLAGGMAHEVNNMMTAVIGFGELALKRLGPADPIRPDIEEVVKAGQRAAAITQQLLAFSRQQHRRPGALYLQQVVPDLSKLLVRLLGEEFQLEIRIPDSLPPVLADRNQLEQVVVNLALNARDAMKAGDRLSIAARPAELDARYAIAHPGTEVRTGRYVLLVVSDTGHGMTREQRERAFEPFFSTKPIGRGTGLGLSTVYGIVKHSGGYVWLYSEPGLGTTVKVYLPEAPEAAAMQTAPQPAVERGRETILVVEDESVVRRLACSALKEQGYTVLEAENGEQALDLLARGARRVDLVLTDVVMPAMGGQALGRQVARLYPSTAVLYMSGYTGQDVEDRRLLELGAPMVSKPFTPDQLGRAVRSLLDGRAAAPAQ